MANLLPQIHFKFRKQVTQMYGHPSPTPCSPNRLCFNIFHAILEKMEIKLLVIAKEMKKSSQGWAALF
jgi:hypothetical protein